MTRLIRAELMRLRSRRSIVLLSILAVLLTLFVAGALFFSHQKEITAAERANAERLVREQVEHCQQYPDECVGYTPQVRDFLQDDRFYLADAPSILMGFSVGLVVLAFAMAGTFVGSEWHHGLMGNLLAWESRRSRVLLAKTVAVTAVAAAGAFALQLGLIGAMYVTAALRGTREGTTEALFGELLQTAGRITLLVALVAILGVALAQITRSTAIGVGIGLVWLGAFERVLGVLRPGWRPWLVGDLALVLVSGEASFIVADPNAVLVSPGGGFASGLRRIVLQWDRGALVLALYFGLLLGLAALEFRRRDVT